MTPRRATALELAAGDPALEEAVRSCRQLLNRRALVGGAASAIPLPGLDWAVDAALLSRLVPRISARFGLTPEQLAQLPAHQRDQAQRALAAIGTVLAGKFLTRDLLLRFARRVGVRLVTGQLAKFVPFAGQIVSAAMGYSALRALGEAHIRDCVEVVTRAKLALPAAATAPTAIGTR